MQPTDLGLRSLQPGSAAADLNSYVLLGSFMPLPEFDRQPNERTELQPAVVRVLIEQGVDVREVNGVFDLLVVGSPGGSHSFIELKVRLQTQSHKIPLSPAQWRMLRNHNPLGRYESAYRVLIYDARNNHYSLVSASNLAPGITANEPQDTSYINNGCLNSLPWSGAVVAGQEFLSWLRR